MDNYQEEIINNQEEDTKQEIGILLGNFTISLVECQKLHQQENSSEIAIMIKYCDMIKYLEAIIKHECYPEVANKLLLDLNQQKNELSKLYLSTGKSLPLLREMNEGLILYQKALVQERNRDIPEAYHDARIAQLMLKEVIEKISGDHKVLAKSLLVKFYSKLNTLAIPLNSKKSVEFWEKATTLRREITKSINKINDKTILPYIKENYQINYEPGKKYPKKETLNLEHEKLIITELERSLKEQLENVTPGLSQSIMNETLDPLLKKLEYIALIYKNDHKNSLEAYSRTLHNLLLFGLKVLTIDDKGELLPYKDTYYHLLTDAVNSVNSAFYPKNSGFETPEFQQDIYKYLCYQLDAARLRMVIAANVNFRLSHGTIKHRTDSLEKLKTELQKLPFFTEKSQLIVEKWISVAQDFNRNPEKLKELGKWWIDGLKNKPLTKLTCNEGFEDNAKLELQVYSGLVNGEEEPITYEMQEPTTSNGKSALADSSINKHEAFGTQAEQPQREFTPLGLIREKRVEDSKIVSRADLLLKEMLGYSKNVTEMHTDMLIKDYFGLLVLDQYRQQEPSQINWKEIAMISYKARNFLKVILERETNPIETDFLVVELKAYKEQLHKLGSDFFSRYRSNYLALSKAAILYQIAMLKEKSGKLQDADVSLQDASKALLSVIEVNLWNKVFESLGLESFKGKICFKRAKIATKLSNPQDAANKNKEGSKHYKECSKKVKGFKGKYDKQLEEYLEEYFSQKGKKISNHQELINRSKEETGRNDDQKIALPMVQKQSPSFENSLGKLQRADLPQLFDELFKNSEQDKLTEIYDQFTIAMKQVDDKGQIIKIHYEMVNALSKLAEFGIKSGECKALDGKQLYEKLHNTIRTIQNNGNFSANSPEYLKFCHEKAKCTIIGLKITLGVLPDPSKVMQNGERRIKKKLTFMDKDIKNLKEATKKAVESSLLQKDSRKAKEFMDEAEKYITEIKLKYFPSKLDDDTIILSSESANVYAQSLDDKVETIHDRDKDTQLSGDVTLFEIA